MPMPSEDRAPTRAPPPPVPTATPEPAPTAVPEPTPEQEPAAPLHAAAPNPPTKIKHRGLIMAIGGLFKRKPSINADNLSDSEASQRRTSRWSHWSNRQSLPEAPMEVVAASTPAAAPILEKESESAASTPHMEGPPAKKAKKTETPMKEKAEKLVKEKKLSFRGKQSPSDPSELSAASSDESGTEPQRVSFLFFGGSEVDSTFMPELRPSELDDLHENDIRPSLLAKMPLFFSPLLVENMRRSSMLPDEKEYEF